MKIIQFKDDVKIKRWTPALHIMMDCLHSIQNDYEWIPELMITSCNDGKHMVTSQHYKDVAFDVRSHNFASLKDKQDFVMLVQKLLGPKFYIFLEDVGLPNEHFHMHLVRGVELP